MKNYFEIYNQSFCKCNIMRNIKSGKIQSIMFHFPAKLRCVCLDFLLSFEFPTLWKFFVRNSKIEVWFFFPDNIYLLTRMIPDKIDRHLETYKYHLGLFRRSMAVFGPLTKFFFGHGMLSVQDGGTNGNWRQNMYSIYP